MNSPWLRKRYQLEINNIVELLKNKYGPKRIILYGSAAAGDLKFDSDIDLLIIKNTSLKRRDRIREVSDLFLDRQIPFEPMVLTEQEFGREMKSNPVIRDIVNSGKIIYEHPGIKTT